MSFSFWPRTALLLTKLLGPLLALLLVGWSTPKQKLIENKIWKVRSCFLCFIFVRSWTWIGLTVPSLVWNSWPSNISSSFLLSLLLLLLLSLLLLLWLFSLCKSFLLRQFYVLCFPSDPQFFLSSLSSLNEKNVALSRPVLCFIALRVMVGFLLIVVDKPLNYNYGGICQL